MMIVALLLLLSLNTLSTGAQTIDNIDRDRGRDMLNTIKEDIKKYYYDSAYHGMDVDTRFKQAEEKIKQAKSLGQVFGIIAQALLDLEDSHTRFIPPLRAARTEYGWEMQVIADKCFVVGVKPGSDAEAKGLKQGDEVLSVDGARPTRRNYLAMQYLYNVLRPQPGMRVVVQSPAGEQRQLDVMSKTVEAQRLATLDSVLIEFEKQDFLFRHRTVKMGDETFIWKMPQFDMDEVEIDGMMKKIKKHKSLILDLRGNGGGAVVTLLRLLGHFFEKDVKVGDLKGRKEMKPMIAKTRGDGAFEGRVVVLVDSLSGSASELLARVMQLEKRAVVIGDRTAGAVMRSQVYVHDIGGSTSVLYGVSITDADVIMTDGKSLEHTGVTPDETLLPTAADMAAKRDPVLARAASIIGLKLEPEKAGAFFPLEWPK
jgi:carboxyl-terminal processing protease